jgi:hypothetical protein
MKKLFVFRKHFYTPKEFGAVLKKNHAKLVHVAGEKNMWAAYRGGFYTGRAFAAVTTVEVS